MESRCKLVKFTDGFPNGQPGDFPFTVEDWARGLLTLASSWNFYSTMRKPTRVVKIEDPPEPKEVVLAKNQELTLKLKAKENEMVAKL